MNTMKELERIGEFIVHPVASIFPMMTPKESLELGMSIADIGLQEPVVVHEGLLVDGRNRVKECIACGVPVRTVEWSKIVAHNPQHTGKGGIDDLPATTVDAWIMAKNIARRSLTEDQRLALWSEYNLWQAEQEARDAKREAAFKPEDYRRNPGGKPVVNTDSCSAQKPRDVSKMHANSTVGKVAAATKSSHHKAAQAVKLVKAVQSGAAPAEDLELVKAGLKKLNEAVKPLRPPKPEPAPITLEERVKADYVRMLERMLSKYAPEEREQAKQIIKGIL